MTIEWYRRFEDCSCQPFSFTGKIVKKKRFVNEHIMNHSCVAYSANLFDKSDEVNKVFKVRG